MNTKNIAVLVNDSRMEALSLPAAKKQFGDRFSIDLAKKTYSFDSFHNIEIGRESGSKTGIIGVYDLTNEVHQKNMDAAELVW